MDHSQTAKKKKQHKEEGDFLFQVVLTSLTPASVVHAFPQNEPIKSCFSEGENGCYFVAAQDGDSDDNVPLGHHMSSSPPNWSRT